MSNSFFDGYDNNDIEHNDYDRAVANNTHRAHRITISSGFGAMPVTIIFLIANILTYLVCRNLSNDSFMTGGVNANYILINKEYGRLFSYMFLHADFSHLACNMFALAVFGNELEKRVGSFNIFIIYFLSGFFGGLTSMYANNILRPETNVFCIGASGAIFGLMSATFVIRFRGSNKGNLTGLVSGLAYIIIYALGSRGAGVDFWCHLGGGIVGAMISFLISMGNWEDYNERINNKLLGIVSAIILCILGITNANLLSEANPLPDERIDYIKEQTIPSNTQITYEEFFNSKFSEPKWEAFTAKDNLEVVNFSGRIFYEKYYRDVTIQFLLQDNNTSYQICYVVVENLPETETTMRNFLEYLFK